MCNDGDERDEKGERDEAIAVNELPGVGYTGMGYAGYTYALAKGRHDN